MSNVLSIVQPDEMTDAEESAFDAAVADPRLIKTEAEARGVLHLLNGDIEDIRQQLAGAKIEAHYPTTGRSGCRALHQRWGGS
jgi:hypothetical protein